MTSKSSSLKRILLFGAMLMVIVATGCNSNNSGSSQSSVGGKPADSIGVGPVTAKIALDFTINTAMAAKGKSVFESRCTACHKIDTKYIGPALIGVTQRRRPEWIMNMILNPTEMIQKDETAKDLLATYIAPMANQNLTQDEARTVLEFFRRNDLAK